MQTGIHAMIAQAENDMKKCRDFVVEVYDEVKTMALERVCLTHRQAGWHHEKMCSLYKSDIPNYIKYEIHNESEPHKGLLYSLENLQRELSELAAEFGHVLTNQIDKFQAVHGHMALQPALAAEPVPVRVTGAGFHSSRRNR